MDSKYTYEIYDVKLSKSDEGLLIRFDDFSSGSLFSKLITDQTAKDVSDQSFDAETIYQMLKDFFDNKPDKVILSFTPDGKLTYSCQIFYGNIPRKMGFIIHLDKENLDPLGRMERLMNKLSDRVSALENQGNKSDAIIERFQQLEDRVKGIGGLEAQLVKALESVEKTEERYKKLEELLIEKIEKLEKPSLQYPINKSLAFQFDTNGPFADYYTLSNYNRTAIAKTKECYSIFAKDPIPYSNRYRFSFLIEGENSVIIGIVKSDALNDRYCYSRQGVYGYQHEGHFLKNGKFENGTLPPFKKGDKVSFVVNMKACEFSIFLNEKPVGFTILPGHTCYPFLCTNSNEGAGATFVLEY